jgi:hypothetical protein
VFCLDLIERALPSQADIDVFGVVGNIGDVFVSIF